MTISIRRSAAYDGPNLWLQSPVLRLLVDPGPQPEPPAGLTALLAAQPALQTPGASQAPWFDANDTLPMLVGRVALRLQQLAGLPVHYSAAAPAGLANLQEVIVQRRRGPAGLVAVNLTIRLLNSLLDPAAPAVDLDTELPRFRDTIVVSQEGEPSARVILDAAEARGIPVSDLDQRGMIRVLGNGAYQQRVYSTATSLLPFIGDHIAVNKRLTNEVLKAAGLPVPESATARTVEQAVRAVRSIGYPAVVKPLDQGDAIGVAVDLRDESELRAAFELAIASTRAGTVVIERHVEGNEYRAMVVNDRVIGVMERVAPRVTGDGTRSVRQLIENENASPSRGATDAHPLRSIPIDDKTIETLARQGLTLDDVPVAGRSARLRPTGHIHSGGERIDHTDSVHPDNVDIVRQAARAIGLDIAAIDLIATDISRSIWEAGGAVLEVNSRPGFTVFFHPSKGPPRDPGPAIIEMLFPPGAPVRVPIVAVTGPGDRAAICRVTAQIMLEAGNSVGLATSEGVTIAGIQHRGVQTAGNAGIRTVLHNPAVDFAVVEVVPEDIARLGLCFDYCDIAVVTGVTLDKAGRHPPLETVLCRSVGPEGIVVLCADDPNSPSLEGESGGQIVWYWQKRDPTRDGSAPGRKTVEMSPRGSIVLRTGEGRTRKLKISEAINGEAPDALLPAAAVTVAKELLEQRGKTQPPATR